VSHCGQRLLHSAALVFALGIAAAGRAETPPTAAAHFDLNRPEISRFLDDLGSQGLDRAAAAATLAQAEPQPRIIESMTKPAEKTMAWWEYRSHFLTNERLEAGVRLWREHRELLDQVALRWHVEPQYVLAIVGIETYFGRTMGHYRVLDALATLAFDYPPRAEFFRSELAQFLILTHEEQIDPLTAIGSYAGAMGASQFMPSSYRHFAVNEDASTQRNLWSDWGDIFASTANYLQLHGWRYGEPVLADAQYSEAAELTLASPLALGDTLGAVRARGIRVDSRLPDDTPCVLLAAPLQSGISYRVGFNNFHVITLYNRSPLYAMAVHDLAEALVERIHAQAAP
jgi:membrane-bound lytic murein transglycosylase B